MSLRARYASKHREHTQTRDELMRPTPIFAFEAAVSECERVYRPNRPHALFRASHHPDPVIYGSIMCTHTHNDRQSSGTGTMTTPHRAGARRAHVPTFLAAIQSVLQVSVGRRGW